MSSGFDMQEILELPEKISDTQQEILNITDMITITKNDMSIDEQRITTDIVTEINEKTDKPMFSNETARKNELQRRLRKDDDYKEKQAKYGDYKTEMERKKIRLDFLYNRNRAISRALRYMELGLERENQMRGIRANLDEMLDMIKKHQEVNKE